MDQSKNFKLIILGQDKFFIEEVISIISTRYAATCVELDCFTDVEKHFVHSIPPDGIIVQSGHDDYSKINEYLKNNDLDILLISFSPIDCIEKIDTYFAALNKWFSEVPFLPLNSDLAGFVGYTPVDLFLKIGSELKLVIPQRSFISDEVVKSIFSKGDGFFFMKKEDRQDFEDDWRESTSAYFKIDTSEKVTRNGPMEILIPFLESTGYHGIPESDQYLLFSALERIAYLLDKKSDLSDSIRQILKKNTYQLKHTTFLMCMNIATLSALGIGSSVVYFNVTLASLVHDLGTLNFGFEEYEFNNFAMENMLEESLISSYSRHGEASLSLLVKHQICPRWVAEMVLSHHESDGGYGYPLGIHSSSMGLATFIFAFNHEWAEKLYGYIAKEKTKVDRAFYLNAIPSGSLKAKELKAKILEHLKISPL